MPGESLRFLALMSRSRQKDTAPLKRHHATLWLLSINSHNHKVKLSVASNDAFQKNPPNVVPFKEHATCQSRYFDDPLGVFNSPAEIQAGADRRRSGPFGSECAPHGPMTISSGLRWNRAAGRYDEPHAAGSVDMGFAELAVQARRDWRRRMTPRPPMATISIQAAAGRGTGARLGLRVSKRMPSAVPC